MKKFSSAISSMSILIAAAFILPAGLFSQVKAGNPKKPDNRDLEAESRKFVKGYWDDKIARCGEYSYMIRNDRPRDPFMAQDEYEAGLTLYEIKGITYEMAGAPVQKMEGAARNIRWSGMTTAKFESYRKMIKSVGKWSEWINGGSDSSFYEFSKGDWWHLPRWPEFTSCIDVEMFHGRVGIGKHLPAEILNATFREVDGKSFTLGEQKGIVVVNLWATWCGPCRMEMPALIKLQEKYKNRDLTVIGFDVDSEDTDKMINAFRKQMEINYALVTSDQNVSGMFAKISRAGVIPQSFVIFNGKLVGIFKGYSSSYGTSKMEEMIEGILDQESPQKGVQK